MRLVVFPAETDERLCVRGDIFPFLPDQPDPHVDRWNHGDPDQFRQLREHGGEKEAAALALPDELEGRHDLAAVHDDPGADPQAVELLREQLILNGVVVEQDQRLPVKLLHADLLLPCQRMAFRYTEQ